MLSSRLLIKPYFTFLLVSIAFLLSFSSIYGQCPAAEMKPEVTGTDDCVHDFVGIITEDGSNTFEVNFINMTFDIDNGSSAIFTNEVAIIPPGIGGLASVSVANGGKRIAYTWSDFINPVAYNQFVNEFLISANIEGDAGDVYTITRSISSRLLMLNGSNCAQTTATFGPFAFGSEEVSGAVESVGTSCPDTQNLGVEGVNVTIQNSAGDVVCDLTTANDGSYRCEVCPDTEVTICADIECPEPCGISASDVLDIRDIVLGIKTPLNWNIIAGDITGDGLFNSIDAACLQRKVLGINDPVGHPCHVEDWCKFISEENLNNLQVNTSPIGYNDPGNCSTTGLPITNPAATLFQRIMLGDMDGSCNDCVHGDGNGSLFTIPFDISNGQASNIYTLTSEIPMDGLFLTFNTSDKVSDIILNGDYNVMYDYFQNENQVKIAATSDSKNAFVKSGERFEIQIIFENENPRLELDNTAENIASRSGDRFKVAALDSKETESVLSKAIATSYKLYSFDGMLVGKGNLDSYTFQDLRPGNFILVTFDKENQIVETKKIAKW